MEMAPKNIFKNGDKKKKNNTGKETNWDRKNTGYNTNADIEEKIGTGKKERKIFESRKRKANITDKSKLGHDRKWKSIKTLTKEKNRNRTKPNQNENWDKTETETNKQKRDRENTDTEEKSEMREYSSRR